MNDQQHWSRPGVVGAIVGGFALLLFLLIAGFAGEQLANVGEPGWAALVALLAACGILAAIGGFFAWWHYRRNVASLDPYSIAGLRERYEARGAVASSAMIMFLALPLVLVRQTYWSLAPWAALLSALIWAVVAVWAWRASLRLQDQRYRAMPPLQLWQELQRHRPSAFKHARHFMLFAVVFALAQLAFQLAGLLMGWTDDTFPPRTVRMWTPWLQLFYLPSFALTMWSQARLVERWRQTFHIARG